MKRFYIKISGSAWDIQASTPSEAEKAIKDYLYCYCSMHVLEIGKDVDEKGWPIQNQVEPIK
jgi:hypothetical protein